MKNNKKFKIGLSYPLNFAYDEKMRFSNFRVNFCRWRERASKMTRARVSVKNKIFAPNIKISETPQQGINTTTIQLK